MRDCEKTTQNLVGQATCSEHAARKAKTDSAACSRTARSGSSFSDSTCKFNAATAASARCWVIRKRRSSGARAGRHHASRRLGAWPPVWNPLAPGRDSALHDRQALREEGRHRLLGTIDRFCGAQCRGEPHGRPRLRRGRQRTEEGGRGIARKRRASTGRWPRRPQTLSAFMIATACSSTGTEPEPCLWGSILMVSSALPNKSSSAGSGPGSP